MKKDSIHLDTQFWDKCINCALVFLFFLPKFTILNFQKKKKKKITRKNIFIHSFFFIFWGEGGGFVEKKKKEILFIILLSLYAEIWGWPFLVCVL